MSHIFLLVSSGSGAGLTTVALGLVHALDQQGFRVGFCKPIAQLHDGDSGSERSTRLVSHVANITAPAPISLRRAESLLGSDSLGLLLEDIVSMYQQSSLHKDVVIVEGLIADGHAGYATLLNTAIAQALDAEVILIAQPETDMDEYIGIASAAFSNRNDTNLTGVMINKVQSREPGGELALAEDSMAKQKACIYQDLADKHALHLIACIPEDDTLAAPRTCDIAGYLDATVLHCGDQQRRVLNIALCARTLAHTRSIYEPNSLLIMPGDRDDIFVAACMSAMNGVPLAGILLTCGLKPSDNVTTLCAQAIDLGIPVLMVESNSYKTAAMIARMPAEIGVDDFDLIDRAVEHVATHLDTDWLKQRCKTNRKPSLSPAAFRYQLVQSAIGNKRNIVLPEGEEPRTVLAAQQCQQRGIAQCMLLGDPGKIHQIASAQGIRLDENIRILEPSQIREQYIEPMVALRCHKGLTKQMAEDQLQDNIVLGTMMLSQGIVDGLVAGAVHTTSSTVRPALQLIGTSETAALVSSVFFMCMPDQVVVYGDCAINPDPDAGQLADIAIQSADSAALFGIEASVAMISYSTGESGAGSDVDNVRQATRLAQQRRPDLMIDGPLQYDAAAIAEVGKSKAPKSPVAGKATVFVFPDLNTGNTTYKAVQRSAGVVSIGPMLQGLRLPVNDLSRGASVEDIVYTIALTCIQAKANV